MIEPPIADVIRSPSLDGIIVVARDTANNHAVLNLLQTNLRHRPRRSPTGFFLNSIDAQTLLSSDAPLLKWEPAALRFVRNRSKVRQFATQALPILRRLRSTDIAATASKLTLSRRFQALDSHQVVNVAAMTMSEGPGLCLFDEQGAGKTVSMIFAFDALVASNEIDSLIIVAPKSMIAEWPNDFRRFTGDMYRIGIVTGTENNKQEVLSSRPDVLVTNYETIVAMETEFEAYIRSMDSRVAIAIDESFFIKTAEALRTQSLRRLREWCARAYVLCGTPAPNSPMDLIEQFNFVDFGYAFEGVDIPADRSQALLVIQALVDERGLYIRNLKADVLPDLPTKQFERVIVRMSPQQAALYETALQSLNSDLQATTENEFKRKITTYLAQRSALLQLCSDPASIAKQYTETPAKFEALDQLLHHLIVELDEKVILWSFYTKTIDRLIRRYEKYCPVRYDGSITSVEERRAAVHRFQEHPNTKIFIANPAAAGAGLTLHSARFAVYESLSNQPAHYLQSLDRIHRRGQDRPVTYFLLACEGTIENLAIDQLLAKERSSQLLLDNAITVPSSRKSAIEETMTLLQSFQRTTKQASAVKG